MAQRILRPLGYGDLLDELFDLYKKNFILFAGIYGVVQIPISVLSTFASLPWMRFMEKMGTGAPPADPAVMFGPLMDMLVWLVPIGLVGGALGMVAMGATTWAVSSCYLGVKPTILQSYKAIVPRILPLVGTILLMYVASGLGLVVCCIGIIPVMIFTSLATETVVLEGKSPIEALKRSYQLTLPNWARILVITILGVVLMTIVQSMVTAPLQVVGTVSRDALPMVYLISSLLGGVVKVLTMPIWIITYVLLYYDIRVRSEGFDIEMLAAGMGAASPEPVTPGES